MRKGKQRNTILFTYHINSKRDSTALQQLSHKWFHYYHAYIIKPAESERVFAVTHVSFYRSGLEVECITQLTYY